jgi:pimeloyl-ACP methyl ester carboxylesterase
MRYLYHLEVERIRELLDRLGVERCTLLGHDYGGHIGLGFCLRYPERVASLAIINSRAHGTFRAPWYAIFEAISRAARTGIGARLFEWMPLEAIHRIVVAREVERGIIDARSLDSYAGWMGRDRHAGRFLAEFFADYSCAVRPDLVEGLSEIACPTAVIWGREDRFLDERIARELASGIEGAELVWLEGAGHFSLEERPGEVLGALRV